MFCKEDYQNYYLLQIARISIRVANRINADDDSSKKSFAVHV